MKKGTLMIAIFFVVFLLLGCLFLGCGLMLGGGLDTINWARSGDLWGTAGTTLDDWTAGIPAIHVRTDLTSDADLSALQAVPKGEGALSLEGEIRSLNVVIEAADFELRTGGKDFSVEYDDARKVSYALTDGVLVITEKDPNSRYTVSDGKITLNLPKGTSLDSATFYLGAGDVEIDDLTADTVSIEVGAGNFKIEDGKVRDMTVKVGVGNFDYDGSVTGNLMAEVGMGNLQMDLDGNEKDHNYEISCGAGDVQVGGTHTYGLGAERSSYNNVDSTFTLKCGLGNLRIDF